MKKVTIILLGILFTWFTLDITGCAIGRFVLVTSAFQDEPIDILWWAIFLIASCLFVWRDRIGKYVLAAFLGIWGSIQYQMYFMGKQSIARYNAFFQGQGTNRILPVSDTFLAKDTYHLFLDVLILSSLICIVVFILRQSRMLRGKKQTHL